MRVTGLFSLLAGLTIPIAAFAQGEVSVERGLQVSITGGCHDCHTEGYNAADGKIDPTKALTGSSIGWRGPWGTTYAINLRLYALRSEQRFVAAMKKLKTRPPMPWYNVRAMDESDLHSLYQYIKSLGDVGKQAPFFRNPGEEPRTPYICVTPNAEELKVVGAIEHEPHNLQAVAAAVQGVVNSSELEVDSYRISIDRVMRL